jgi:signal peptidase I
MKEKIRNLWRDNKGFLLFIILMIVFRSSLADWNTVPTGSMKPTILEGDRILVNKLSYDLKVPLTHIPIVVFDDPERGDIVIFDSKVTDNRLVKRVIGIPGDVVALRNNRLFINGVPARYTDTVAGTDAIYAVESYAGFSHRVKLAPEGQSRYGNFGPVSVPANQYFVLGDNRDDSADSRFIGFVPRRDIVGKSARVVVSLDYDNYFLPRADRFFHQL